jgi:hypothetical protein
LTGGARRGAHRAALVSLAGGGGAGQRRLRTAGRSRHPARVDAQDAGIGLFVLTLAVTPAHVYMLQRPELFPVPLWALWLRLPVQAALLWLILWSTRRAQA